MSQEIKTLRSNTSGAKLKSDSDMSVSDLANLMKSQFSTYQNSSREEFKRMSDSLSEFASFQKSTKEEFKRMEKSLSVKMDKLKDDISTEIEQLREENKTSFLDLTLSIDHTKAEAHSAIDRNTKMNDLIVSGVPFTPEEDLSAYFKTWCLSVGYSDGFVPLVDVKRLSKGIPKAGEISVLLIQFAITNQRNDFFARYLRSRNLTLSGIGFTVNQRIYINENLGVASREIRSKALAMKNKGLISGVFTRNGLVYAKKNVNDRAVVVMSESELNSISQR